MKKVTKCEKKGEFKREKRKKREISITILITSILLKKSYKDYYNKNIDQNTIIFIK